MAVDIVPLDANLVARIPLVRGGAAWNGGAAKWNSYWAEVQAQLRLTRIAVWQGQPIGYGSLLRRSTYPGFSARGVPEISDLAVAEGWRQRGIGRALIGALERCAVDWGYSEVGIGVGLYADYGAAQRLYAGLGYVPDGRGITYLNRHLPAGALIRLDDDAVLWLTRRLR